MLRSRRGAISNPRSSILCYLNNLTETAPDVNSQQEVQRIYGIISNKAEFILLCWWHTGQSLIAHNEGCKVLISLDNNVLEGNEHLHPSFRQYLIDQINTSQAEIQY